MSDYFYAGVYWGPRREDADECAARLAQFLDRLAKIGDPFGRWYLKGRSKAALTPLEPDPAALAGVVEAGQNKTSGEVFEELGFVVTLWNRDRSAPVGISVTCGLYATSGSVNSVVVDLPDPDGDTARALYESRALSDLLETTADIWDADWGMVTSSSVRDDQYEGRKGQVPYVGALTYLSSSRPVPGALPDGVAVRQGKGSLFTVVSDVTSVTPDLVRPLRARLEEAGSLYPTPTHG